MFKAVKIVVYSVCIIIGLVSFWFLQQLPDSPDLPKTKQMLKIDEDKLEKCKNDMFLVALNFDEYDDNIKALRENLAGAYMDFLKYEFNDSLDFDEKRKIWDADDALRESYFYDDKFLNYILKEFGFVAGRSFKEDETEKYIETTFLSQFDLQKYYVSLNNYLEEPTSDYAKMFCYFYK